MDRQAPSTVIQNIAKLGREDGISLHWPALNGDFYGGKKALIHTMNELEIKGGVKKVYAINTIKSVV